MQNKKTYSIPALKRLPAYLRELRRLREAARERVSSPVLARALRIDTISARKDLDRVGAVGSPGVGYRVRELIDSIETFLGWKNVSEAFLIGIDGFGAGLLGYGGFSAYGLKIIAAFDADPGKIGTEIHGRSVFGVERLEELVRRLQVRIGIICVPAAFAQEVADAMVAGGIRAIWNFANVSLKVPEEVVVQREVIAGGLAVLSVKMNRRLADLEQQDGN